MSNFAFEAQCVVSEDPDGECHLAGFADRKYDTELYLMLQRGFEDDEQEVELGQDTFYVEWCGQENSRYGGITRFLLKPGTAEVTFDTETTELLYGMDHLHISFHLPPAEYAALREALDHIFHDLAALRRPMPNNQGIKPTPVVIALLSP